MPTPPPEPNMMIRATDAERMRSRIHPMVLAARALMAKAGLSPAEMESASILSREPARR